MGFFSVNEHSNLVSSVNFPVLEGYGGAGGCGLAIVEGYQNDFALFTAAVNHDMMEMQYLKEGYDIEALTEASVAGMWNAIKEFFRKLGAKIKALFTAFIAKIESYFTNDLKDFVKKYEKNLAGKDFKDMKAKYSRPKHDNFQLDNIFPHFGFGIDLFDNEKYKKYEDEERSDMVEEFYKNAGDSKTSDGKEFDEWYHEQIFEDEDEKDSGWMDEVSKVKSRLVANTRLISDTKKTNKKILDEIAKIIKDIDKQEKSVTDLYKKDAEQKFGKKTIDYNPNLKDAGHRKTEYTHKDGDTEYVGAADLTDDNKVKLSKSVNIVRQQASCYQEVILHITQTIMKEIKFGIAQDKRIFAKAVAYKKVTDEATLLNAIGECAFDETVEYFDSECVA